jgi:hypothetical protein
MPAQRKFCHPFRDSDVEEPCPHQNFFLRSNPQPSVELGMLTVILDVELMQNTSLDPAPKKWKSYPTTMPNS